jgi:yopX protein|nr:MAG TPA: YopX protein [Caudoviricetes sp.]
MNIFEDMKVFIKPLAVVSPVSEINVNSDSVWTHYGAFEVKDVFLILKTGLKDKHNKDIYVGDVITDGETEYEVLFNVNGGFFLKSASGIHATGCFIENKFMQFAVSNYEIISNIYVEMQEKRIQNGIFKERCLFDIQNIIKDIS